MENIVNTLTLTPADKGQLISVAGGVYRIIISGKETGGAYAAIEMMVPAGGGPNPHAHPKIQESFYVLEGEIEVKNESGSRLVSQGGFVNIPLGGMVHCFKNKTDKLARLLCVVVPSGLEEFFLEVGKPIDAVTFLPAPVPDAATMEKINTIAEKFGQILYPPNYLG